MVDKKDLGVLDMRKFILLGLLCGMWVSTATAQLDLPPALLGLGDIDDALPPDAMAGPTQKPKLTAKKSIIPFITSRIAPLAAYNLVNAEQVFCYRVDRRPEEYTGYTLNNFAVVDYCGELDNGQILTSYEALFSQGPNIITTPSSCRIEPRIMLRFVRGVDYTDVLLSSPCPSFTVYYAGKYDSFNIKQNIIDDVINRLEKTTEPFNSPTLLKQTVANGTPATPTEEELLEKKKRENAPVMNWKKPEVVPSSAAETSSTATPKPVSGWGNIKLRK
jgi:hypothetical protein